MITKLASLGRSLTCPAVGRIVVRADVSAVTPAGAIQGGISHPRVGESSKCAPSSITAGRPDRRPADARTAEVPELLREAGLTLLADGPTTLPQTEYRADGTRIDLPAQWFVVAALNSPRAA